MPDEILDRMSLEERTSRWHVFLESPGDERCVVIENEQIGPFGYAWLRNSAGTGEVRAIYLHPAQWGQGWGRHLLDAAESDLVDLGAKWAFLWVFRDNWRARQFYERMGWERDSHFALLNLGGADLMEVRYQKGLP